MIPETYQGSTERIITSYNYTDIADGTGVIELHPFASTDSTGESYLMAQQHNYYSDPQLTNVHIAPPSHHGTKTVYFALTAFNTPKEVKGDAILSGSFRVDVSSGGGATGFIVFTLQKYDGSTATDIGTITTETISSTNTQTFVLKITTTKTHFKKGEILRLKALLDISSGTDTNADTILAHDPSNRDAGDITAATNPTDLILAVPFNIPN